MSYKVGDIVKGKYAGMFRIKGFRAAAGYEGADLIPLNPETLQAGRHPSMWMQIENISPMDADMDVRHPSGLVWMKAQPNPSPSRHGAGVLAWSAEDAIFGNLCANAESVRFCVIADVC